VITKRLERLDALRGIAALSVVLSHGFDTLSATTDWRVGTTVFNAGYFGVSIFFLISGLVMARSATATPSRSFWVRRLFRLYPAFWVSLAAAAALYHPQVSVASLAANATMLPQLFGQPLLLVVYWTLAVELLFYMLMSGLAAHGRINLLPQITIGLLAVGLVTEHLLPYLARRPLGLTSDWLASSLALLCTGAWMGQIWHGARPPRGQYLLLGAFWALHTLAGSVSGNGAWMLTRLLAATVFLLVLRSEWQPHRLLRTLGEISYALYLVHVIVIDSVAISHPLAALCAWLALSCVAAYLVYHGVERPGMAAGRLVVARWREPERADGGPAVAEQSKRSRSR